MGERFAVVGATGYTGGLVVRELMRRGGEVVAIGRNAERLQTLPPDAEPRVVDIADTAALRAALDGCRAVVSCVGSFLDLGEAVVAAAITAGIPYVDTTGEFPFLHRVFEVHDARAQKAGVAIVPGTAFYSAPADLAADLATRALGRVPDSIEIGYLLRRARPSRGTLRTNLRRAGLPCPVWQDGRLISRRVGDDPRPFRFPLLASQPRPGPPQPTSLARRYFGARPDGPVNVARWPGGEVLTVPRHTGARSVAVFLGMPKVAAAVFRNPGLIRLVKPVVRRLIAHGTGGPSEETRARARFVVVVEARTADGDGARCVVEGHDLYGLTAAACAEAAQRLGTADEPLAGALAPAEAFDPASFLDALSGYLAWRVEPAGGPSFERNGP